MTSFIHVQPVCTLMHDLEKTYLLNAFTMTSLIPSHIISQQKDVKQKEAGWLFCLHLWLKVGQFSVTGVYKTANRRYMWLMKLTDQRKTLEILLKTRQSVIKSNVSGKRTHTNASLFVESIKCPTEEIFIKLKPIHHVISIMILGFCWCPIRQYKIILIYDR